MATFQLQGAELPATELACLERLGFGRVTRATPVASGANNTIFAVEFGSRKLALKKVSKDGICRLLNEQAILTELNGRGAPRIHSTALPSDHAILIDWVDGVHPYALDAAQAGEFGRTLRAIHSIAPRTWHGKVAKPSWRETFEARLATQLGLARESAPRDLVAAMENILERIHAYGHSLTEALGEDEKVLVHIDLIPLNILSNDGGITIIDWELGRIDYPEWDLCSIAKAFEFTPESRAEFDAQYGTSGDPDRTRFVSLMHYANVALWRLCSFYVRGENQSIRERFLTELDEEMDWLLENLP